jgi:hypothetical protein
MPKRNRIASLLVLPLVVFVWMIGWVMCLTGEKKVILQNKKSTPRILLVKKVAL